MPKDIFAIIAAAGVGKRFGGDLPKQYIKINNKTILEHTLDLYKNINHVKKVFINLSPQDHYYENLIQHEQYGPKFEAIYCGDDTRSKSILKALISIRHQVLPQSPILVHDAVRPCVSMDKLISLIEKGCQNSIGAILVYPICHTLKKKIIDDKKNIFHKTIPRENIWAIQSPQIFRYDLLKTALKAHQNSTDESSAIDALGQYEYEYVIDSIKNIKLTYNDDLEILKKLLR